MEIWKQILQTAILAPSPHNVQPWRIKIISDHEAELLIDGGRTLPKEDVTGSFIILTMGLFIEAVSLIAANHGLLLDFECVHDPQWYAPAIVKAGKRDLLPFARLKLVESQEKLPSIEESVFSQRRTSRVSLLPQTVPDNVTSALQSLARKWDQRYEQITNHTKIEWILAQNTEALFEDLNSPHYHDEIVEWFRFTDRSSQKHRDGLDYRCMNTSRLSYWLVARMPWLMLFPLTRPMLRKTYRKQLGTVPTIGMIAGKFWEPEHAIQSGRFLMHFWLELTKYNLYIHPFGNLVTNKKAAESIRNELGIDGIWLIFKIGYSSQPPQSYRLPLEQVLVT
jgi:nitroreductase